MIRRPPRSTRTDTLFPYTTLFRSGPGGAPFFTRLRLKGGMTKQLLYNTLGPIELWALSTTQEDVQIRNRLYDRIGPKRARRTLSKVYPSGSALSDVERRRAKVQDAGYFDEDRKSTRLNSSH